MFFSKKLLVTWIYINICMDTKSITTVTAWWHLQITSLISIISLLISWTIYNQNPQLSSMLDSKRLTINEIIISVLFSAIQKRLKLSSIVLIAFIPRKPLIMSTNAGSSSTQIHQCEQIFRLLEICCYPKSHSCSNSINILIKIF